MKKASSRAGNQKTKGPAKSAKRPTSAATTAVNALRRDEMLPEYDFSGGVRAKYASRFARGRLVRIVVLAPDVAEEFRSARAVNTALRRLLKEKERTGASGRRRRPA